MNRNKKNQKNQKDVEYYMENGTKVTERITSSRTIFIEGRNLQSKKKALAVARRQKSYIYNICQKIDGRRQRTGFGIPK